MPASRTAVVAAVATVAAASAAAALALLASRRRAGAGGAPDARAEASERRRAQEASPRDPVAAAERETALELLQILKQRANLAFQEGRYEDALEGYQECVTLTSSLGAADEEAARAEQVIRANVAMTLLKQQRYDDARLVTSMLLHDELWPLQDDLKVKVLYRRGLASKALGDRDAALADMRAAVYFSPGGENKAAAKEIEALERAA